MTTRLSDVIEPRVFLDYMAQDTMEKTAFWQSGVVTSNPVLVAKANTGGRIVDVPFWRDLPNNDPNISSDNPATLATPDKIDAGTQIARIAYLNRSWAAADLASQIAGSNAMQRIAARVDAYWQRAYQRRLLAMVRGLIADNIAGNSGDMIFNAARTTAGAAAATNGFTRANFTSAAFTLGDAFEGTGVIAMHSVIYKRLVDNEDIDFIKDSVGNLTVPTYLGRTIVIDDGMPAAVNATSTLMEYTTVLFGQGSIGIGEGTPQVPVAVNREEAQGNGAGIESLFSRKIVLMHPMGYQFNSVTVAAESPTLAELQLPANWTRVIERKAVPLAFLITN